MRRNVAFTAWIAVLEPSSTDFGILFVDHMFVVGKLLFQSSNYIQPAGTGSDSDDADLPGCAKGLFADLGVGRLG